jgi:murein DD-endopeptidase MepM/ murein hydrolase activator NlpD
VYAAAAGTVLAWVEPSGTLILDHGDNFYTMYTHMASAPHTQRGELLLRGAQVGNVGDRGAPGNPHLHFTAFTANGPFGRGERKSVPLQFAEGYNLPNIGGCDQHNGAKLVSGIQPLNERPYRAYLPYIDANNDASALQAAAPIAAPQPSFDLQIPRRWRAILLDL